MARRWGVSALLVLPRLRGRIQEGESRKGDLSEDEIMI
jgi:hypothetical protein